MLKTLLVHTARLTLTHPGKRGCKFSGNETKSVIRIFHAASTQRMGLAKTLYCWLSFRGDDSSKSELWDYGVSFSLQQAPLSHDERAIPLGKMIKPSN
jgi:hypothetical protein